MIGILKLPPGQRAPGLEFLRAARARFCWQPLDLAAAAHDAQTRAASPVKRRVNDLWLASLARSRNLIVATRNVRDFKALGDQTFNPFEPRASAPPPANS